MFSARAGWRAVVWGIFACVLWAWPAAAAEPAPTVVMISMDGLHPADLRAAAPLPALERMAREGAAAERMTPAFPSNTFPNHVTLATGVSPERHGVVNNAFSDPVRGEFSYESDPTWLLAEPIWAIADRHGVVAASYYWVGSEGKWSNGHGPRYWKPFNSRTATPEKVDQILAWLALPEGERPRLITAWFHGTDHPGHRHGPQSEQAIAALREQDGELGRLLAALDAQQAWAHTTLILVSDHGMQAIEHSINLQGVLSDAGIPAKVHGGGGFVTVTLVLPEKDRARAVAAARGAGLEAWARGEGPPGLETRHERFGDFVALAPPGTTIRRSGIQGLIRAAFIGGGHGYRPSEPAMSSVFLALGRGVAAGHRPNSVRARDVAPTVLTLLGLPVPETMEGRPIPLATSADEGTSE